MALRDELQKIALAFSAYGNRRITRELGRRGYPANHKRVLRLMRLRTTDSAHSFPVFPRPPAWRQRRSISSGWPTSPTSACCEFVYLVVCWTPTRAAWWAGRWGARWKPSWRSPRCAWLLEERRPAPGLVHHSDRGVQCACGAYTALLAEHGLCGSMSRTGNPYDNAFAESFIKTLKYEEVYRNE